MKNLLAATAAVVLVFAAHGASASFEINPLLTMDYDVTIKVCQQVGSKTLDCKTNCTSYTTEPKKCLHLPSNRTGATPENLELSCSFSSKCFQYNGYQGTTCTGTPFIKGATSCNLCEGDSITLCDANGVTLKNQCDEQCNNCQMTKSYPFNSCLAPPDSPDARVEILPGYVSCARVNITKFMDDTCDGSSYGYSLNAAECDDNWGNGISVEYECTPKGIAYRLPKAPVEILEMISARVEQRKQQPNSRRAL